MFTEFEGVNGEYRIGEVITSLPRLKRLAHKLMKVEEFAYDTETNTLRVQHEGEMKLVGISICFGEHNTYYIPTGHYFDSNQLSVETVVKYLKPCFEREDVRIIGWNLKFDLHVLANVGINIKTKDIFDGMIARWITDENQAKSLKECTSIVYGVSQTHFDECLATVTNEQKKELGLKSANKAQFWMVQLDVGAPYALADAYWTWRHYVDWQMDEIKEEKMETIFYKVQMKFLVTLFNMERRGVRINLERLKEMSKKAEKDMADMEYRMVEIAGVEFSPTSGQQLAELLFGYKKFNKKGEFSGNAHLVEKSFNYPVVSETAGGMPQTGDSQLKAITQQVFKKDKRKQEGQELVRILRDYKRLAKLKSAFIDGLLSQVYADGKVHPSFNQVGCLTSETLVPTDKGIFQIGQLADLGSDGEFIEKELNIVNRYRELEPTKYVVKYENRDTVKIVTNLGFEIEGTLNHPLIVNRYGYNEITNNLDSCRLKNKWRGAEEWKKLEDITTNDYIAVPIGYNTFSKDYVTLNPPLSQSNNTNAKQINLPRILDEDLAEFMGMYYADGSIHEGNGSFSIRITNGNSNVVNRVKELSLKLFGIEPTINPEPNKNSITTYITSINLKPLEELLELKREAVNKVIPNSILQSPKSVVKSFIRGLTLDSCFIHEGNKDYLKFTFSNKISARYVQELLLNIGIISSLRQDKSKTDNVFNLNIYNEDYVKFRDVVGFIEFEKCVEIDSLNSNVNHYRIDRDTLWIKVREIIKGKADVFDFNVPETHSFISGAFISHNTDSGRLSCSEPKVNWAVA